MKKILFVFLLFSLGNVRAQETSYFENAAKLDFSQIWMTDSIEEGKLYKRHEPLGFIGDNYQRLYIHFISMIQNIDNPYEYFVYGKSKVKNNICEFQGTIVVKDAKMDKDLEFPELKAGYIQCDYHFFEDQNKAGTGQFKGTCKLNWYFDKKNKLKYNALIASSDDFTNSEFIGQWISYKTGVKKRCNWGDYRIPDSGDLDSGAGEFVVNEKYKQNGWENYSKAYLYSNPNSEESVKARKIEELKWWQ